MSDKEMERINAKCLSLQDQHWMALEAKLTDVMRIGMHGPTHFNDDEFVRRTFVMLGFELTHRRELREKGGAT